RAELVLRRLQLLPPLLRQILPRPVDVEHQHRHRRTIWIALAPLTVLRRTLQRLRDAPRAILREDVRLEVQSVALLGHVAWPSLGGHTDETRRTRHIDPSERFR